MLLKWPSRGWQQCQGRLRDSVSAFADRSLHNRDYLCLLSCAPAGKLIAQAPSSPGGATQSSAGLQRLFLRRWGRQQRQQACGRRQQTQLASVADGSAVDLSTVGLVTQQSHAAVGGRASAVLCPWLSREGITQPLLVAAGHRRCTTTRGSRRARGTGPGTQERCPGPGKAQAAGCQGPLPAALEACRAHLSFLKGCRVARLAATCSSAVLSMLCRSWARATAACCCSG